MNKDEWDAMITSMNRDYHQAQEARNRAKAIPMPENPEAWVGEYLAYAEQLPDQLPQKEVMLRHARMAQACLAEGDEDEAKFYMLMLMKNWNNAEHDRWVNGVERQYAETARKRNEQLKPANEARWRMWRDEADKIRKERPALARNKSALARIIKKRLNLPNTVRAIRNRL